MFLVSAFNPYRLRRTFFTDRRVNGESIHQTHEFFSGEIPCFFLRTRPLEGAFHETYVKKYEPVTGPQDTLEPVFSCAAEEEQGILFKRIAVVSEPDDCGKPIDSFSEI